MKNLMKNIGGSKKAQFFSYDAIVAAALFAVLLTLLFVYWSSIRSLVFTPVDDMFRVGISVSDTLLTPGNPIDWNYTNVNQIGLTDRFGSNRLNISKVANLSAMATTDYALMKGRLGTGYYDIQISVAGYGTIGAPPEPTASGKITIVRPVIYNNAQSNLSITIWSNYTI